jgi:hypothetical protein
MARLSSFVDSAARSRYEQAYNRTLATVRVDIDPHDVPTEPQRSEGRRRRRQCRVARRGSHRVRVKRTAIAGSSSGGWLAAKVAVLRPELVSGLILISPALVFTKYRTT